MHPSYVSCEKRNSLESLLTWFVPRGENSSVVSTLELLTLGLDGCWTWEAKTVSPPSKQLQSKHILLSYVHSISSILGKQLLLKDMEFNKARLQLLKLLVLWISFTRKEIACLWWFLCSKRFIWHIWDEVDGFVLLFFNTMSWMGIVALSPGCQLLNKEKYFPKVSNCND